ncbi:MAG: sodium/panthothenate symporter, partial [Selenomonas bovis]|nr:sodium/panthothenate symporter [Selenomonas bovis]
VDNIIPLTIARAVPPELVGLAIIGPLAASISTISGLLIVASSAIVKDVYLAHMRAKGRTVKAVHLSRLSVVTTAALGVLVFALALTPPSLIWIINMFAFGGLETAFFWMLLLGLYWRGANRLGALLSMAGGTVAYCAAQAMGWKVMGLHQITIGITVSLVLFLIGARLGRPTSAAVLQVFFPGERGEEKG